MTVLFVAAETLIQDQGNLENKTTTTGLRHKIVGPHQLAHSEVFWSSLVSQMLLRIVEFPSYSVSMTFLNRFDANKSL